MFTALYYDQTVYWLL